MEDGTIFTLDTIICATGFDTSFCPAFPVIGQQGKDLRDVWKVEPRSYLSVTASGFPNYFRMLFPSWIGSTYEETDELTHSDLAQISCERP